MSQYEPSNQRFSNLGDTLVSALYGIAKFLLSIGGLAGLVGIGFLLYMFFAFSGGQEQMANAMNTMDLWSNMALWGCLAACIGAAWLMWGEETVGVIMLIVGLALFFCTMYLPSAGGSMNELKTQAMGNLSLAGLPAILIGFITIAIQIASAIKFRQEHGSKSQMKYGKEVTEERDVRNVLMGKCWQLPYCRKFVRERCPIYHAKRTCWKERVGCMCEETVIKNAMDGKTIPKDMVGASKFIPRNAKLTPSQKAERCKQCVIYNEHQKHKYKIYMPLSIAGIVLIYLSSRGVLASAIKNMLQGIETTVETTTGAVSTSGPNNPVSANDQVAALDGGVIPYHEIVLVVLALVAMAYVIKFLEYLIFKLKV